MKNLREIFRLPKRAKIALMTLSAVAVVLLISSFALQKWADSQVESANLVLTKIDKNKSESLNGVFAYEARVHFERLDFLLRSRTISHIDLQSISWVNGIDSSAIKSIETHNRRLNFTTTQNLLDSLDSGANLGVMSFKMDFSALPKMIAWYYMWIVFAVIFVCVAMWFYDSVNRVKIGANASGGGGIAYPKPNFTTRVICFTLPTLFHAKLSLSHAKR